MALDAGDLVKSSIAVVIGTAFLSPVFTSVNDAESISNLSTSEQAIVGTIGLAFAGGMAYSVYQAVV